MSNLIQPHEISGDSVYGVKQYEYTVGDVPHQDYIAALTVASLKQSVAIENTASACAVVVRQRERKVSDLGIVLAALATAISTMDPKSNNPDKRSSMLAQLYDAQSLSMQYGISLNLASIHADLSGGTASITYRNATQAQNDVQYALDTEDNNLKQDMVSLQSLISKRDNAYSTASKVVKKASNTSSGTIHNMT